MAAAVLHGKADVRVETRSVPMPDAGDVLVEISHCGICGTDLHMVVEGWGTPGTIGGHEWSGTVIEVGPGVNDLKPGDAVVGGSMPGCDACEHCRDGRPALCLLRGQPGGPAEPDGAFAGYVCRPRAGVVALPSGLDLRTAALAEPLAVALHAVHRSGVSAGQRALVTGAGPIGMLVVVALRCEGVHDIVVSEPSPSRRALAQRLGATTLMPDDLETPTIAEPSRIVDGAFDVALECSGRADAIEAACSQLRRRGTLVLVGTGLASPNLDPNRILLNELVLTGAFEYGPAGIESAVQLLASGTADVSPLIESTDVPLDGLLDAMQALVSGTIPGKVLVTPNVAKETL